MSHHKPLVHRDPWQQLTRFTDARIAIGRAGTSITTSELLQFQLSHAQAIDAVHTRLDLAKLQQQLSALTQDAQALPTFVVSSQVSSRQQYLQRPDLGRSLSDASAYQLKQARAPQGYDLAIVIADGLSATAIQRHAAPFLGELLPMLSKAQAPWSTAPITLVQQGRVAIGDDIAQQLNARLVIVLIGERPGLSSPDSMGCYLTWAPQRGCDDAARNCISNIRPAGLAIDQAAAKCFYLMCEARRLKLSGVQLKDRSQDTLLGQQSPPEVFNLIAE